MPNGNAHISQAASQRFIDDNSLDDELFRDASRIVEAHLKETDSDFYDALELVRVIQPERNQLENPHVYSSTVFGFDGSLLSRVHEVIRRFDLTPFANYLAVAQSRQRPPVDLFDGFVDTARDGVMYGCAVNLSQPERQVPLEVRIGAQIVATGLSGEPRPDVASAGYPSSTSGFPIPLPDGIPEGFCATIANSTDRLHDAGTWRQGWHCE